MTPLIGYMLPLLATDSTREDLEKLRAGFLARPSGSEQLYFWGWVLAFVAFVALAVVIARLANRRKVAMTRVKKVDYLTAAVDVLGISETDRRTLLRVAARAHLEQPASMLLSPMNMARALALAGKSGRVPNAEDTFKRLCQRLFGAPLPTFGEAKPPAPSA